MDRAIIYHNPQCSKSRATLTLLEQQGLDPEVILYLENPPTPDAIDRICMGLACTPLQLMRIDEPRFGELELSRSDHRTRSEWIRLLAENPVLMERPIVQIGDRVAICRPPEQVLSILEPPGTGRQDR